ncbi:hypothetical protein [Cerasicoccus arenae]|uniref:hypothetical protein n=1 Tax=Cerasicoccus arenae TaxID=424488 RepID=UPI00167A6161|nr:hypothetical protein [Cerasicoccus arenae]MBK1857705.1 hypothetical protein [Cerasicoccus arenae]
MTNLVRFQLFSGEALSFYAPRIHEERNILLNGTALEIGLGERTFAILRLFLVFVCFRIFFSLNCLCQRAIEIRQTGIQSTGSTEATGRTGGSEP